MADSAGSSKAPWKRFGVRSSLSSASWRPDRASDTRKGSGASSTGASPGAGHTATVSTASRLPAMLITPCHPDSAKRSTPSALATSARGSVPVLA